MVSVTLCARLLKNEPIPDEVEVGDEPEEDVVVGIKSWPSVEVLSCENGQKVVVKKREKRHAVTIWYSSMNPGL